MGFFHPLPLLAAGTVTKAGHYQNIWKENQ
jgi:hypothetical protein